MKKMILIAAVILAGINMVNAQTTSGSAKVKVNVILNPFQTISIGSGAGQDGPVSSGYDDEVTLEYKNTQDYNNGVEKNVLRQLKVSSVGSGYQVNATLSDGAKLKKAQGSGEDLVDASQVLKIAVGNKQTLDAAANMSWGPFGSSSGAESSVLDQEIDVKYIGKPITNADLLRKMLNNKESIAKYSVDVVYTIAAN
ncbi:hypothetical protein VJ786_01130 [Sphingobacterium sp. PU5-4]|uniref:Uncharacterized protein n=1 Tax=Sphingobacterium tenebrionis TaxID=3111775 RepID=A0ABU8I248_9SPHI